MTEIDSVIVNFDTDGILILNTALAFIMFGVALGITTDDFKNLIRNPGLVFIGLLSQFVLLPFISFLLVLLLKPIASLALGMLLIASCPGGNVSNFFTHLAKGNSALSVSLSAVSTLLAIVMTPLNLSIYGGLYPPTAAILNDIAIDAVDIAKVVVLILGIPLVLGMLVRHYKEEFAKKHSQGLKVISIIVLIVFLVVSFARNLDVFTNNIQHVFGLGVTHNFCAMVLGYLTAMAFGLTVENRRTISIETGIQNPGLGLLLAFTFFAGLGGTAMVIAFWGIWHVITGLSVATYWSRSS